MERAPHLKRSRLLSMYGALACIVCVLLSCKVYSGLSPASQKNTTPVLVQRRVTTKHGYAGSQETVSQFHEQTNQPQHQKKTVKEISIKQHLPLDHSHSNKLATSTKKPSGVRHCSDEIDTLLSSKSDGVPQTNYQLPLSNSAGVKNRTQSPWKNIAIVSQSEDLDLRSKWQMQQVGRFCRKYGMEGEMHTLPPPSERHPLYQHLMFSSKRRFIFCYLPKSGSTSLRRLLYVMEGLLPEDSIHWEGVAGSEYMHQAITHSSFKSKNLTDTQRVFQLRNYFKFMMIRNPLGRLVSAYRDKIEPPLEFSKFDKQLNPMVTNITKVMRYIGPFQAHRRLILSKYRPHVLRRWARANGSYNLSVSFPIYVRWLVETRDSELNEHFSSILFNTAPCRVGYHLFLNFNNYSRDVRLLIPRLNTSSHYFVDHKTPGPETSSTLPHYFSLLSTDLRRRLFARLTRELDFYYHLYPEEQLSHVGLLGTERKIYSGMCSVET